MKTLVSVVYPSDSDLTHYQVKGAKHGVRRWQYPDGSLTPEGRIHYGVGPARNKQADEDAERQATTNILELSRNRAAWETSKKITDKTRKKALRRKGLFESKAHYEARRKEFRDRYDAEEKLYDAYAKSHSKATEDYIRVSALADDIREVMDGIENWETEQVRLSYQELEDRWNALSDIVDEYAFSGEFNDYNKEYIKQATLNEREANKVINSMPPIKDTNKFASSLAKAIDSTRASDPDNKHANLNGVKELNRVDTSAIVNVFKDDGSTYAHYGAYEIADRIAKKMLGDSTNTKVDKDDPSNYYYGEPLNTAQDIVRTYLMEKAHYESGRTDWSDYFYYQPPKTGHSVEADKKKS